jgi:hypothetical protein
MPSQGGTQVKRPGDVTGLGAAINKWNPKTTPVSRSRKFATPEDFLAKNQAPDTAGDASIDVDLDDPAIKDAIAASDQDNAPPLSKGESYTGIPIAQFSRDNPGRSYKAGDTGTIKDGKGQIWAYTVSQDGKTVDTHVTTNNGSPTPPSPAPVPPGGNEKPPTPAPAPEPEEEKEPGAGGEVHGRYVKGAQAILSKMSGSMRPLYAEWVARNVKVNAPWTFDYMVRRLNLEKDKTWAKYIAWVRQTGSSEEKKTTPPSGGEQENVKPSNKTEFGPTPSGGRSWQDIWNGVFNKDKGKQKEMKQTPTQANEEARSAAQEKRLREKDKDDGAVGHTKDEYDTIIEPDDKIDRQGKGMRYVDLNIPAYNPM